MVPSQMTRGAAISMLLALISMALIVLLAWPTHSAEWITPKAAASREVSQLIKVADWTGEARANAIFVHGFGGHAYDTWQRQSVDDSFWPLWVAEANCRLCRRRDGQAGPGIGAQPSGELSIYWAATLYEIDPAIEATQNAEVKALNVLASPMLAAHRKVIFGAVAYGPSTPQIAKTMSCQKSPGGEMLAEANHSSALGGKPTPRTGVLCFITPFRVPFVPAPPPTSFVPAGHVAKASFCVEVSIGLWPSIS
jgi:hypothetical protein